MRVFGHSVWGCHQLSTSVTESQHTVCFYTNLPSYKSAPVTRFSLWSCMTSWKARQSLKSFISFINLSLSSPLSRAVFQRDSQACFYVFCVLSLQPVCVNNKIVSVCSLLSSRFLCHLLVCVSKNKHFLPLISNKDIF